MEWSKLKNIVLLILLGTNLCLLVFVLQKELGSLREQQQTQANAVEFLAQRGIRVREEEVPSTRELLPQTVERSLEGETAAAAALLGGDVSVESRGGEVYRYFNGNGSVRFHSDGAFSAEFSAGFVSGGESRERTGAEVLKRMGFEGEAVADEEDRTVFRQCWQTYTLFSHQVTLVWEGDSLSSMVGGRRLVGEPESGGTGTPVSEASALIHFRNGLDGLGDVCSEIKTITQGYVSATSLTGPMTLNPVWRIATDTGMYQMDLLTGALSRVA